MEIGKEEIKGQKTKGNYGMKKNKKGTTRTALDSNRYRTSAQPNPRTDNIPVSAIDNQKSITQRVSKKIFGASRRCQAQDKNQRNVFNLQRFPYIFFTG